MQVKMVKPVFSCIYDYQIDEYLQPGLTYTQSNYIFQLDKLASYQVGKFQSVLIEPHV